MISPACVVIMAAPSAPKQLACRAKIIAPRSARMIAPCTYVSRVWLLDAINDDRQHSLRPLAARAPLHCMCAEPWQGGGGGRR
jgi:hypothetical protein